jgi:hypothetical protein
MQVNFQKIISYLVHLFVMFFRAMVSNSENEYLCALKVLQI